MEKTLDDLVREALEVVEEISVDAAAAVFASGSYVRRHQSLRFTPEATG